MTFPSDERSRAEQRLAAAKRQFSDAAARVLDGTADPACVDSVMAEVYAALDELDASRRQERTA